KGESPIKGGGKLLVIDGGFSKAYQPTSGIAGYTLIFTSRNMRIVSHQPFAGKRAAIEGNHDDRVMATAILVWTCYNYPLPTKAITHTANKRHRIISEASI
ncbi:MAG: fructose-bisphosphatase class III, partial [Bacteroidaceae bacterium]|nr:fructose-bisphosphatase class III [Bacteroidaceae bacterium]